MSHIVLIGCGNIGFRHLQAILAMSGGSEIHLTVVEPNADMYARIQSEIAGVALAGFDLVKVLPRFGPDIDLAVLATSSDIRKPVLDGLLSDRAVKAIILEKVLFQTQEDLVDAELRLRAARTRAYVNCGRRGFPGYQKLREDIASEGPIHLTVTGSNYALASNGIHFIDLAEFLNGAVLASLDGSRLAPGTLPSKRPGFIEVSGELTGLLTNGATVELTCHEGDAFELTVSIQTTRRSAQVDEQQGKIIWKDGSSEAFETLHVSSMPYLYETALSGNGCVLTPYAASAAQHRLFLAALLDHQGAAPDAVCSIS